MKGEETQGKIFHNRSDQPLVRTTERLCQWRSQLRHKGLNRLNSVLCPFYSVRVTLKQVVGQCQRLGQGWANIFSVVPHEKHKYCRRPAKTFLNEAKSFRGIGGNISSGACLTMPKIVFHYEQWGNIGQRHRVNAAHP